jgi:hypothetical protein
VHKAYQSAQNSPISAKIYKLSKPEKLMNLKKRLIVSAAVSMAVFIIAFFTTLIPCQISPSVPNPNFSWQLCTFNPDLKPSSQFFVQYFGATTSLMDSYLILILGVFCLSFIILMLLNRKKRR